MPYAAALDANVLHPIVTVEVLLRLVERGLFRPVWSREILDEVRESLERRGLDPRKVARRIEVMVDHFPEALVDDVEPFLEIVPLEVDADDRHVVAAALAGKADAIVTNDLNDFPAAPLSRVGLEVQSLDAFLLNQWTLDTNAVVDALRELEEDLRRPPMSLVDVLNAVEQHAPEFVSMARRELMA